MLESVERTSSLMAKLELDEQVQQAEKVLNDIKQQFDKTLEKIFNEADEEKKKNFEQLRPTLGQPARKHELEEIDNREKARQNEIQKMMTQFRSNTIVSSIYNKNNLNNIIFTFIFRKTYKPMDKPQSRHWQPMLNVC